MKRFFRILILAVALVAGLTTVSAQTAQVLVTQKVPVLPTTVTSYLDDPFRYFNIQCLVTGAGSEGIDVFFDAEFTVSTQPVYVRTRKDIIPSQPLHLSEGLNLLKRDELDSQVHGRMETNFDFSNPLAIQQLPEGTYQLCVDIYLWSDKDNPNRVSITTGPCPSFDICYSGSAPELTSPLAGAQLALNGAMVVTPARKVNFFWTPATSNCATNNPKYKYQFKVTRVLEGQNYRDAIQYNPTVFSAEVRNSNFAVLDTLRDLKVQMERGVLYVAQVKAEPIKSANRSETFILANDGMSQPLPFYWGSADNARGSLSYNTSVDDESEEDDESEGVEGITIWDGGVEEVSMLDKIVEEMKEQYLAGFIQDDATIATLTEAYPDEEQYVPTPKRRYVASDGYYTVPMADKFEMTFMPARHEALKDVSYTIEVYENINGDIDSITANDPLLREEVEKLPERYNKMNSHELISRTLDGWGAKLTQGNLYYLQLSSSFTVGYWKYSVADTNYYVNEQLAEHVHDTISREFVEEEVGHSNGVFFQWGDDPDAPAFKTPQWKAPVDRTGDDIYDPANYKTPVAVPEIQKNGAFPVSWTPVRNVTQGDTPEYEVKVYELKKGQTLKAALSNKVLVERTVTTNAISADDAKFFKVFSTGKTYVMTLSTTVNGESDTTYHFENGNEALPVVIKIVK